MIKHAIFCNLQVMNWMLFFNSYVTLVFSDILNIISRKLADRKTRQKATRGI